MCSYVRKYTADSVIIIISTTFTIHNRKTKTKMYIHNSATLQNTPLCQTLCFITMGGPMFCFCQLLHILHYIATLPAWVQSAYSWQQDPNNWHTQQHKHVHSNSSMQMIHVRLIPHTQMVMSANTQTHLKAWSRHRTPEQYTATLTPPVNMGILVTMWTSNGPTMWMQGNCSQVTYIISQ